MNPIPKHPPLGARSLQGRRPQITSCFPRERMAHGRLTRWRFAIVPRTLLAMLFALGLGGLIVGCADEPESQPLAGNPTSSGTPAIREWTPGHHGEWMGLASTAPPLNVLLISLDTTRQDHLGCYGFTGDPTPNLDQLANEGILFTRGTTPVPVTLPAHATMMTGLYPFHHGVRNNGTYEVADSLETLAEVLGEHGYATGAITAAFPVAAQFGLDQGFDTYDDEFPGTSDDGDVELAQRPGDEVTTRSLEWIDRYMEDGASSPFFLWAHYFDPHYPYEPPEPFASRFPASPYAGEVAFMDDQIGRLLDGLRDRLLLERTVIFVVGDHGESLGEHGEDTHSILIYNATQYVPFLLRLPEAAPQQWSGRRIEELVSLVDVLPTLLDATGIPRSELPPNDGLSLLPLIDGGAPGRGWVYYESLIPKLEYGASDLRALETKEWKYIDAPRPELYFLTEDPKERSNRVQRESWHAEELAADLAGLLRSEIDAGTSLTMDQETIEKLQSLGYLAGSTTPSPGRASTDPKDIVGNLRLLNRAAARLASHRAVEAVALTDSILARFPRDGRALRLRASGLFEAGLYTEAIDAYDTILENCDPCADQTEILMDQARALSRQGQHAQALERFEALREATPELSGLDLNWARALLRSGDLEAAQRAARQTAQKRANENPGDIEALLVLADAQSKAGRISEAKKTFETALERTPQSAEAMVGLGALLAQIDGLESARAYIEGAYEQNPDLPEVLFTRAWLAVQDSDNERALRLYLQGLERQPHHADALFSAGTLLLNHGQPNAALEYFRRAIATGRAPLGAWANSGVAYAQLGRLNDAINQWERALTQNPDAALRGQIQQNLDRARQQMPSRPN